MTCGTTMTSTAKPGHRHECHLPEGHDSYQGHVCHECGKWFWTRKKGA